MTLQRGERNRAVLLLNLNDPDLSRMLMPEI